MMPHRGRERQPYHVPHTGIVALVARGLFLALTILTMLAQLGVLGLPGVLGVPGSTAVCHAAEYNDFQTWWDITTIYKFNDRWRYDGDQGTRGIVSNEEWTIAYVRPSVRYMVRPWFSMHGGIGFVYTFQKIPGDRFEMRPWIGFRFIWPQAAGFAFSHYFRFEDRYNYSEFRGTWDEAFRGRYQLGVKTPGFNIAGADGFYGVMGIEFFKDLSGEVFERFADRGRFGGGLGKGLGDSWRVELHYIYQSSALFIKEGVQTDEHILRLRFYYTFH